MNHSAFAAVTRRAAAVSRRSSVHTLGGAALAGAFAAPAVAAAGKAGKKARQRKKQLEQCRATVESFCAALPPSQAPCEELYFPCCEHFARGRVGAGVTCLYSPSP